MPEKVPLVTLDMPLPSYGLLLVKLATVNEVQPLGHITYVTPRPAISPAGRFMDAVNDLM